MSKAQLDKKEREHLEDVVGDLRERVEDNVRFQLTQKGLGNEPEDKSSLDEGDQKLVDAIELEKVDGHTWSEAFEQYVTGVGYTIVNRLAALRCMEVRGFIDKEVTVFKDNGLTPAAETLVNEEFLLENEAILQAYHNECDKLSAEIEILFDTETAYSQINPDHDAFEELCTMLDRIPDKVWHADDVLGWVYEYYNIKLLEDLRKKGNRGGLDPEDVPPANQFYTPHWVVRMLTDNSLGKLYLENKGELEDVVKSQEEFSPSERKNRPLSPNDSSEIADFCTYLVPSKEEKKPAEFDHPSELRVIDPACGSGHFLLYAFDVLERIWRTETDLDKAEIPNKILKHNLYGVDLDMRACQLAAFNLYLKGRTRAEAEGANMFDMPEVGIVCADAKIADIEGVEDVFAEVAEDRADVRNVLENILDAFEEVHGLGSLLDIRGTLGEMFEDESGGQQLTLTDDFTAEHTLSSLLQTLHEATAEHRDENSFLAQDLRSFIRLLDILSREYDVALMNPPYGAQGRMPDLVQDYVEKRYEYGPEFYINFFEVCDSLTTTDGRIGMLIPRSFMFKRSFQDFREDFIGDRGGFDFLAEFGLGILDNATVRTVGTVVRSGASQTSIGTFIRLHDADTRQKEQVFTTEVLDSSTSSIKRVYNVALSDFDKIPKTPLSYYTPDELRSLHENEKKLDADAAGINGTSVSDVKTGLQTGDNDRFIRTHWEVPNFEDFVTFTKGGSEAWVLPQTSLALYWGERGLEIKRQESSVVRNEQYYFREGLTWTYIKEGGRRFGYFPSGGIFDQKGPMTFPSDDLSAWVLLAVLNSELFHGLFLSLTPDREWNPGDVGRIPWDTRLQKKEELANIAKEQYKLVLEERVSNPISPYYRGATLLPPEERRDFFHDHPHTNVTEDLPSIEQGGIAKGQSFSEAIEQGIQNQKQRHEHLEDLQQRASEIVYNAVNIPSEVRSSITTEIELRGSVSDVSQPPQNIEEELKSETESLVHHVAMTVIDDAEDGIVPIESIEDEASMYELIINHLTEIYGQRSDDRLAEIDEILGSRSDDQDAYPNLRRFISNELFETHIDYMENTPILWRLTTTRQVSDPHQEGFGCFIDYRSIDSSIFDRLQKKYLEQQKANLRDRRNMAERRRNDESIPTSEQAAAAEEYERCVSGLEQIAQFEETLQDLASSSSRNWEKNEQKMAQQLGPKVNRFYDITERFADNYETLFEINDREWLEDKFSQSFIETVDQNKQMWLSSIQELHKACQAYSKEKTEPVPAHLYDLFTHFEEELVGSVWPTSTGVLSMGYYPRQEAEKYLNKNGEPKQTLSDESAKSIATIAAQFDDYEKLADEISSQCQKLSDRISDSWKQRAHSEVTTTGYRPVHKHGVEINITPLAEENIVPEIVEKKVI